MIKHKRRHHFKQRDCGQRAPSLLWMQNGYQVNYDPANQDPHSSSSKLYTYREEICHFSSQELRRHLNYTAFHWKNIIESLRSRVGQHELIGLTHSIYGYATRRRSWFCRLPDYICVLKWPLVGLVISAFVRHQLTDDIENAATIVVLSPGRPLAV